MRLQAKHEARKLVFANIALLVASLSNLLVVGLFRCWPRCRWRLVIPASKRWTGTRCGGAEDERPRRGRGARQARSRLAGRSLQRRADRRRQWQGQPTERRRAAAYSVVAVEERPSLQPTEGAARARGGAAGRVREDG